MSPTLSAEFFTTSTTWETHKKQYLIQRQFLFTQESINNPIEIADVADLLALLPMLQAFRNINIWLSHEFLDNSIHPLSTAWIQAEKFI